MKVVFWQNIISIHQVPFIKALAEDADVSLFVEKEIDNERLAQGWRVPVTPGIKVRVINDHNYLELLKKNADALHFFSGLYAYPILKKALKSAIDFNLYVGIIAEPQNWLGLRGVYNRILTTLFFKRHANKINLILAIGSKGKWWYKRCGFPGERIFEWGYVVEMPKNAADVNFNSNIDRKPNLLYVGRLVKMKGIYEMIKLLEEFFSGDFNKLTLVGDGIEYDRLKKHISNSTIKNKVMIAGGRSHDAIWEEYKKADYLVLPSKRKEGWGAVINEALLTGVPIITSNYCGASVLVTSENGYVFKIRSRPSFKDVLEQALANTKMYSMENKVIIRNNAEKYIGKQAYVTYFKEIINHLENNEKGPVSTPWASIH